MDNLHLQANQAIEKLTLYRTKYKKGEIGLAMVKELSTPYIAIFDKYAKQKAKEHKVSFKPFSLIGFLR